MPLIHTLLIANRGEIAARIIRTCRRMGIRTVAVYSEADDDAPFVSQADLAVPLGGNAPSETYLDMDKIIAAARRSGADAIHPGYGFLSENADFARKCAENDLIFIGPRPEAIAAMGSKSEAKALMEAHGVPVVPGYRGEDQSVERFRAEAKKIGYPVLLKAVAGGGGKGMRIVEEENRMGAAVEAAKSEAQSAFGNDELLLEKYFESVRHIEFQIFGDRAGHAIHLLERECTIQRRYQKIIEESPSPGLSLDATTAGLREKMGAAAVRAALALQYDNAGTVEFILDENGDFYFLEVNTRLQVEHPVTEMITGLDLVEWQIRIAEGEDLPLDQTEVQGQGYAIECRLYAEDPAHNFMPATGRLLDWSFPEVDGLRVDAGVDVLSEVSVWYDPMLAKLIVHGLSREEALRKMRLVLREMHCPGVVTNRAFLVDLLSEEAVLAGNYDTHFLSGRPWSPPEDKDLLHRCLIAVCMADWEMRDSRRTILQGIPSGWRNSFFQPQLAEYEVEGESFELRYRVKEDHWDVEAGGQTLKAKLIMSLGHTLEMELDGLRCKVLLALGKEGEVWAQTEGRQWKIRALDRFPPPGTVREGGGYRAPMPSQVLRVLVQAGQEVEAGAPLVVLSSMKMENTITAGADGTVLEILVREGSSIEADTELLRFEGKEK